MARIQISVERHSTKICCASFVIEKKKGIDSIRIDFDFTHTPVNFIKEVNDIIIICILFFYIKENNNNHFSIGVYKE
jgi:hypothetical protein